MIAVIDCGTTNTRVFILDDSDNIVAHGAKKVGVRDTVITGSTAALKEGIKETFYAALEVARLTPKDIRYAVASGMITSEIGLLEIPHLVAPVGLDELAGNIRVVDDPGIWPLPVPAYFIPGIRNAYGEAPALEDLRRLDFMRGEEVQMIGILQTLKPRLPVNIVVLSSHTKLININREEKITGSITTISGQFYEALVKETSIGKCVKDPGTPCDSRYTDREILDIAGESVAKSGLLRTMLMPRFMQVLLETSHRERQLFVDAAIAAADMQIFDEFDRLGFPADVGYILYGHEKRCAIYEYYLRQKYGATVAITAITDADAINLITIRGLAAIARHGNLP